MCTRTPTQEQKQFLDLTKKQTNKQTNKKIYIYIALIDKSAPLASLNYVRELWYLQKCHTEHEAVSPVKLGKGWSGLSSRVGLFFNEPSMAVIMIE